jgi:hypothetical protein
MATMLFELDVEMDGQPPYTVVADQRDVARWEIQSFGWPIVKMEDNVSMLFFRFLAWSASTRQQLTSEGWEPWSARCLEVMPVDAEGSDVPADAEDPGQTVL